MCGAGISGLTVAGQLARNGWEVVLLEAAPERRTQGYMIDFFGPGYDAAEKMGILEQLRELSYPISEGRFVRPNGRSQALDYSVIANNEDGKLMSLMRQDLEQVLFAALPENVEARFGSAVVAVEDRTDYVTAVLGDGSRISGDIVVAADGIHSAIRHHLFGDSAAFDRQLGMHTCAYTFDSPRLHKKLGDALVSSDELDRMVGLYGLRDGKVAMFAAHRVADTVLPADPQQAIRDAYQGMGDDIEEAIAKCPAADQVYYDQVAQVELPVWSRGRVVFAGDACQAVSLLAGQGASLAIAGGVLLVEKITSGVELSAAFAEYEDEWMPIVLEKQAAGRRAASGFLPHTTFQLWVRRAALAMLRSRFFGKFVTSRITGTKPSK
ncbi:FAD-dependent monooxygenase [Salinibacterium sp. M195]|uniref:FAD-dependent monooxygenase n=1 Tax=Salinibacterium sp. M195 TaxID=2583374 RepID=UPI001C639EA9|nr:FAD-dependent monooxygenase [Salinibacterium sp. M195]QYH36838.1 FAD-dependent oxidoreductase [Salinibacterium sp. M195]